MEKVKVAILGTGNIGTDLLVKVMRSSHLECSLFAGRSKDSQGIARAREMGISTSTDSVDAILRDPGCCDIVFDSTNAESHLKHALVLGKLGKFMLDLTPSKLGFMCVPILNLKESLSHQDINLITCGGQSSIPFAHALMVSCPKTEYIELASSIASKSAGPSTRINIDEYVLATRKGIEHFTGVKRAKAMLNLNPAEPPINMHNTLYMETKDEPDIGTIRKNVLAVVEQMKRYTPGVHIVAGPVYEEGRVTLITSVIGAGDFLPKYAGNLDIMTCAAVAVAEEYAKRTDGKGAKP
ncbi:MAG: acetaldehyde dehydrogenase (acetylating) [Candidatus Micrarchaeota archaeon]|nr:acetaldehyde dehydrogenase (acetylating) [Candidatus Micrarchaeota archaeon]